MLSESQERMLLVIEPANEKSVAAIFKKWDLHCRTIGRVTGDSNITVRKGGDVVARIPASSLVLGGGAPVYYRKKQIPAYIDRVRKADFDALKTPENLNSVLLDLLGSPNICSRRWIFRQYDSMVRTNTIASDDSDAAVIRIKGMAKGLALKTDCNPRYVYLNPFRGSQIAVAESARNVACVGGIPVGITNCLNFGNPYDEGVYWQFSESIRGISAACLALDTPVTGGNVSFYNQGIDSSIYPTPVIGMLGLVNDISTIVTSGFQRAGDVIILFGRTTGHLGGSEYLERHFHLVAGDAPDIDLTAERSLISLVLKLISEARFHSCHDISDGGLAVALAECCIHSRNMLGARVDISTDLRRDAFLFGEDQSRVVATCDPSDTQAILAAATEAGVPAQVIGSVVPDLLTVNTWIRLKVGEMQKAFRESFPA
jgi:phosphoribosylformylglycinamidine synthase